MSILNKLFQRVYLINMKVDTERYEHFCRQAEKIHLAFDRFEAVDRDGLIALGYIGPKLNHNLPFVKGIIGRLGCSMSHRTLIECSLERNETCCIIEDDVVFDDGFNEKLEHLLVSLPEDWNFMHVTCGLERGYREQVNEDWYRIGDSFWGTWCYGFRDLEVMSRTLDFHVQVECQHFDTAFRKLGFGNPGTGIRSYRPVKPLLRQNRKFVSRTNFGKEMREEG